MQTYKKGITMSLKWIYRSLPQLSYTYSMPPGRSQHSKAFISAVTILFCFKTSRQIQRRQLSSVDAILLIIDSLDSLTSRSLNTFNATITDELSKRPLTDRELTIQCASIMAYININRQRHQLTTMS